jgi:hypothetical protein
MSTDADMSDTDELTALRARLAEAEAKIAVMAAALEELMDQPTMHPLRMTPKQRGALWAAHAKANAALAALQEKPS